MTMSDWIAVAALVVAIGSLVAAGRANKRAGDAFKLQDRIDAREREFREVTWHGRWAEDVSLDDPPTFELKNTGLTPARDVILVIEMPRGAQAFRLGDIDPGAVARAALKSEMNGVNGAAVLDRHTTQFDVSWSSPLGHADKYHHMGPQIF